MPFYNHTFRDFFFITDSQDPISIADFRRQVVAAFPTAPEQNEVSGGMRLHFHLDQKRIMGASRKRTGISSTHLRLRWPRWAAPQRSQPL